MTSRTPTLSVLGHVAACPGSLSLPHQRRVSGPAATLGTAIHGWIAGHVTAPDLPSVTDPAILAEFFDLAPDDAGRLAFLAEHLRLPVPPGALAEVPLGYFPDGSVRRFTDDEMAAAHAAGLRYRDVGQWLSGTLDAMWAEPEPLTCEIDELAFCDPDCTLWVADWKTGADEHVPPIARNWQLRAGALLAARWTGATRVIPAICYVNAAECAAALREERQHRASAREATENNEMVAAAEFERLADECGRRAREGRWEVGEALDAGALDAIEVELRAVLRAARGESDERVQEVREREAQDGDLSSAVAQSVAGAAVDQAGDQAHRRVVDADRRMADAGDVREGNRDVLGGHQVRAPLILGPHCEFCPARAACPAFAAEALSLARGNGMWSGLAMDDMARAYVANLIPALRRALDAAEEAVRAGGPVLLADGRVYGPALEETTSYATRPTYEALVTVVGEVAADEAFEATTASLKRALEGQERGAFGRLRADVEARGGLVSGVREVWRRRYPAVPVEAVSHEEAADAAEDLCDMRAGERGTHEERRTTLGAHEDRQAHRHGLPTAPSERTTDDGTEAEPVTARYPCPTCHRSYARTKGGALRRHTQPGGGLYCAGEATAAQEALAQLTIGGQ